jgi:hypothetical protein
MFGLLISSAATICKYLYPSSHYSYDNAFASDDNGRKHKGSTINEQSTMDLSYIGLPDVSAFIIIDDQWCFHQKDGRRQSGG